MNAIRNPRSVYVAGDYLSRFVPPDVPLAPELDELPRLPVLPVPLPVSELPDDVPPP